MLSVFSHLNIPQDPIIHATLQLDARQFIQVILLVTWICCDSIKCWSTIDRVGFCFSPTTRWRWTSCLRAPSCRLTIFSTWLRRPTTNRVAWVSTLSDVILLLWASTAINALAALHAVTKVLFQGCRFWQLFGSCWSIVIGMRLPCS